MNPILWKDLPLVRVAQPWRVPAHVTGIEAQSSSGLGSTATTILILAGGFGALVLIGKATGFVR